MTRFKIGDAIVYNSWHLVITAVNETGRAYTARSLRKQMSYRLAITDVDLIYSKSDDEKDLADAKEIFADILANIIET